jgi:hypothetical protein
MDKYGTNDLTMQLGQYETPFADVPIAREDTSQQEAPDQFYSNFLRETIQSPFSRTYETTPASPGLTPAGEEFMSLLGELNDSEFNEHLYGLAAEIEDTWRGKITNETALGPNFIPYATQQARDYINPLTREAESMIDRVSQHFSGGNMADISNETIESLFAELTFDHSRFTPVQEQFLGGIFNKVKSVVKKGVDLAKKGISIVGKILPINMILNKLKGLIKPLLDKVLKFAIGKLPKALQPHAQTLAKKFLNLETAVSEETEPGNQEAEGHLHGIQSELDTYIAQLVFSEGETTADTLVGDYESSFDNMERLTSYETGGESGVPSLNEAREQFIQELKNLQPGDSPAPAIERFLPAALIALQPIIKMAITVIGRPKIINFLAGLLAKLVSKYVPANVAQPLAASIIDVGMTAIGFETFDGQKTDVGYEAIANTIEETIQGMETLNEATLSDNEDLTMQMLESFEKAAANNFPPQYIRPELRTSKQGGVWVMMPRGGSGFSYKKFTRVFDVTIDSQTAAAVTTFRGLPLANFLRDKLGIDPSKPIQAKVHLYKALKNTKLSKIGKYEKLPTLNPTQPYAWVQFHPLTSKAASMLLKEPALGKDLDSRYTQTRTRIKAGQNFYFLEINGARLRIPHIDRSSHAHSTGTAPANTKPSQSSDIQGVINFIKSEIRLNYYFSEEDAKTVVEKLNKNDFLGAAITIKNQVRNVLNDILLKNVATKVKIIHEQFPELYLENYNDREDQFAPLAAIGAAAGKEILSKIIEKLVEKLVDQAYTAVVNYFKARAAEFKEAYAKPQDGVTIKMIWVNIPGMATIRTVFNAIKGKLSLGNLADLVLPNIPVPEIQVFPDKKFD